jgi:hypothetical protein
MAITGVAGVRKRGGDVNNSSQMRTEGAIQSGGKSVCTHQPRHCEARSDVAIQAAVPFSGTAKQTESPFALPLAYCPRNDEFESERMSFAFTLAWQGIHFELHPNWNEESGLADSSRYNSSISAPPVSLP